MTALGGAKLWYTAAELAELKLPGLPSVKRKINEIAADERWALRCDQGGRPLARPRQGKGGGLEYHHALLPAPASLALVKSGAVAPSQASIIGDLEPSQSPVWAWLEGQTDAVRDEARHRLKAVDHVEALQAAGMTRNAAVASVARQANVSPATLWNWLKLIAGVQREDRLPALAPRRCGGGAEADLDPRAWDYFRTDFLRPEKPTFAACHGRLERAAAAQGWGVIPHVKTLQRRLEREVDPRAVILARCGVDELRRSLPPQERSVAEMHALEHVNIDGHKWDVFCRWPDGTVARPLMVAIQDIYSRKMLAWRIGQSESAHEVRLAFADLFRLYGIPKGCTLDNGRGFAAKWITGGAKNRFRFKVQPGDPEGLLTSLGIAIHWTLPYRGQSKPIERMFGDFCGRIAKHPAFAGAYTGNSTTNKPDNYGAAAIPIEDFKRVVAAEIAAHNAREGRETEMGRGVHSFDRVFQESYARSPIRRASVEQMRLALLAAEMVRADKSSGAIDLYGNRYWHEGLAHVAGQNVVVRFDPEDLHSEIHVYDIAGRYLLSAPVWRAVGFLDKGAAQTRARLETEHRRHARRMLDTERRMDTHQLASLLPEGMAPEPMSPAVIRPVRPRGAAAVAIQAEPIEAPSRPSSFDRFVENTARLRVVE